MRYALEKRRKEWRSVITDFHAPFTGLLGAWRLMSVLRFGDPTEVLAVPAMLPHLQAPTLVFHGSRDKAIPQGFALRASALIPDSKVILLDSGHFIPLSNPDAIAKELLVFFARSVTAQVA
jgi:pimeloyl-ACP methyl ester carboxylesterase